MYTGFFPSHFYTFTYLLYSIILLKDKLNLSFEKHFALLLSIFLSLCPTEKTGTDIPNNDCCNAIMCKCVIF